MSAARKMNIKVVL